MVSGRAMMAMYERNFDGRRTKETNWNLLDNLMVFHGCMS
jgi:hypothetical protein